MADLPPMIARPDLEHLAREQAQAGRRATHGRRTEYRRAVLLTLALKLDLEPRGFQVVWPNPGLLGLTEDQAAGIRRDVARVLRNRADAHGGRLRV